MRKIISVLVAIVCLISFNSFAADNMTLLKSFYVGPFHLNQANWNTFLDGNFLNEVSSLPKVKSFKVVGHTDNSGTANFNKKLSAKRAELVSGKLNKLFPDSEISVSGKIYNPEAGQEIDYRMVYVEVYAEPRVVLTELKESLKNISAMIAEIKSKPESKVEVSEQKVQVVEQIVDLSGLENQLKLVSKSIIDLKNSQLDLSKLSLEDKDMTLSVIENTYNGLSISFEEIQTKQKEMFEYFKNENENLKISVIATDSKVEILAEKVDSLINETGRINPWNYILWLVPFLALLIIILVLLSKKAKVQEDVFEWVEVNVTTPVGTKDFAVKCKKNDSAYFSPIRGFLFENKKDLKKSLKSDLVNYFRNEEKSPSYVEANLSEKIGSLIESGTIDLGQE